MIYLDNNATTAVAPEVFEAMKPFLTELYSNPSSPYSFAMRAHRAIVEARERVAELVGARPDEIVFTSCGSESDSAGVWGPLHATGKKHVVTTAVEHPAVRNLVPVLKKRGYEVTVLGVDSEGMIDLDQLRGAIKDETAVVSIMAANNESGVLFPVEEAAQICKEKGALFHTDAVQAVGKLPFNLSASAIDMLSSSGHKLHAPKGVGFLYVKKGTPFAPFLIGGHQEEGRRAGTENVAGIVALGKAAELARAEMGQVERVRKLRDRLDKGIAEKIEDLRVNGGGSPRLPNTTNVSFAYVEGESILLLLDREGICASSGSACTTGSLEPSHVLQAMNVPPEYLHGSIRFSLSRYSTEEEIARVLEVVPGVIARLRELSPFTRGGGS